MQGPLAGDRNRRHLAVPEDRVIPIRAGVQVQGERSVHLLERVTARLTEFQEEYGEEPGDIVFVIQGRRGTVKAGWLIEGPNIRPVLALAGALLTSEALL